MFYTPIVDVSREKGPFQKENSLQTSTFQGDMLVFRGVYHLSWQYIGWCYFKCILRKMPQIHYESNITMGPICSTLPHTSFHLCNYVYISQKRKLTHMPPKLSGVWKNNEKNHPRNTYIYYYIIIPFTIISRPGSVLPSNAAQVYFFRRNRAFSPAEMQQLKVTVLAFRPLFLAKLGNMGNDCAGNVGKRWKKQTLQKIAPKSWLAV